MCFRTIIALKMQGHGVMPVRFGLVSRMALAWWSTLAGRANDNNSEAWGGISVLKAGLAHRVGAARKSVLVCLLSLVLLVAILLPGVAASNAIEVDQRFIVEETGRAKMTVTYTFPVQSYNQLKMNYGNNLYLLFANLTSPRASAELDRETLKITADDVNHSINVSATLIGYAACRRNRWEIPIGANEKIRTQSGNLVLTQETEIADYDTLLNINTAYTLPSSAQDVTRDGVRNRLTFTLAHTKLTSGASTVDVDLRFKPEIMSAVYKIYSMPQFKDGQYWVAKAIFTNTGKVPIYDLKFYYKLGEFSDEETTDRYNVVMPGGAVIDLFYPDLNGSKMVKLRNRTPARLSVRYQYTDPNGKVVTDDLQERLEIYGMNQFCWSGLDPEEKSFGTWFEAFNNAPLTAALVTKNDPVIGQFVGMVSQMAKGAPANSSDEAALVWLRAAYDMMWSNDIVYQTPSGFLTEKAESIQEIKWPRDVLINKSGTCVDLAIFYATVAEATGLETGIMMVPGHAFAVIWLPSGNPLPVENTLIAGGRAGHGSFEQAVTVGAKNLKDYLAKGIYIFVPVHNLLASGVPNPELPDVSPTLLKDLGYTAGGNGEGTGTGIGAGTGQANEVLLAEDFSSAGNGWFLDNSKKDGAFISGGIYEVRVSRKTYASYSAPVKKTIPPSYLVMTDAQVKDNNSKGYYGLLFNTKDWDSFYYLFVIDPYYKNFAIWKIERGDLRIVVDWTSSNLISSTSLNKMAVMVEGSKAAFFINGVLAMKNYVNLDETASAPKVGVMAGNSGGLFTIGVYFDNFGVVGNPQ